jgi:hypothetical protein
MNRNRVTIAWRFDRKTARRKFGYKGKSFKRSKTWSSNAMYWIGASEAEYDDVNLSRG